MLVCLALVAAFAAQASEPEVCFTPGGNCTELVVRELGNAQQSVLVQAYSFTSMPIAQALVEAERRGVDVRVLLDRSQETEPHSDAEFLANQGIWVRIDAKHAIAHNKVMVIDGAEVITGSFNFTNSAQERNAENLLILRDRALAEEYARNWQTHQGHSVAFLGKTQPIARPEPDPQTAIIPTSARHCAKGISCGDACIPADRVCRVGR